MPDFVVEILDRAGKTSKQRVTAPSAHDVVANHRAGLGAIISVSPAPTIRAGSGGNLAGRFAREISILLSARMRPDAALNAMARSASDRRMAKLAGDLLSEVRGGASFSEAMQRHQEVFPAWFSGSAGAAEASGALATGLAELSKDWDRRSAVRGELINALIYPVLLIFAAVAILSGLAVFILPQFESALRGAGAKLPKDAAAVFAAANWLRGALPYLAAGGALAASGAVAVWLNAALRAQVDAFLLRVPGIGAAIRHVEAARFVRTLALASESGASASESVKLASVSIANCAARAAMTRALQGVRRGEDLALALASAQLLPPIAIELLGSAIEAGAMTNAARRLADLLDGQAEHAAKRWVRIAEPAAILLVGLVVGYIVLTLLSALSAASQGALDAL